MNYINLMKGLAFLGALMTGIAMIMNKQYQEGFAVIAAALTSASALSKGSNTDIKIQSPGVMLTPAEDGTLKPDCATCPNKAQGVASKIVAARPGKWALAAAVVLAVAAGVSNPALGVGLLMSAFSSEDAPLKSVEILTSIGQGRS